MIRLSPEAEADLLSIVETIAGNSGTAVARRVYDRIKTALLPLDRFPLMACAGRVAGTRELPVPGLPYIVVYEPEPDGVLVLSVIHGARSWPPKGI